MKKINLSSFKEDSIVLNELLTVRGGSGCTCGGNSSTILVSTSSSGSDRDTGLLDAD